MSTNALSSTTPHVDFSRQLLVAMPGMVSGSLADTVIYICEHSAQGALGLVINRPTDMTVGDLLTRIDVELSRNRGAPRVPCLFWWASTDGSWFCITYARWRVQLQY